MADQLDLDPISRVCAYCRGGIHSSALFAECTYCRLPYCDSCRFEHQTSHQKAVVTLRSVVHQFEVDGETEICAGCSKRVSFSYSCCECDYALCRGCWFEQDINMHQHTIFNVIEPPRLVHSKAGFADACCSVAAVNHCSTCSAPFSLGQETIFCKTCYLQTDEPLYLCVRCYISPEERHPRQHESWQWTVEIEKPGGIARGIHCNDCLHVMRSVEELKAHPHNSYADVYKEKHLNQVIARSYRQCQKKAGRLDAMIAEGSERCSMCLQNTVSSPVLPCQHCNKSKRLCTHCGQHASKLHIHELPTAESFDRPRSSSATVTYNGPVHPPQISPVSLQPLQSPMNVITRTSPASSPEPSPAFSPTSTAISSANQQSPPLSPYRAIEPPWSRFHDEYDQYPMYGISQYPLEQGQNVLHHRSLSDPAVFLPRSRPLPGSPQPYPEGPAHSRPAQYPHQPRPENNSYPESPPISPEPNPARSHYRVPSQPENGYHPASPPTSPKPDPTRSHHRVPSQPENGYFPASPPMLPKPNPIRSHHRVPPQPSQTPQLAPPTPPVLLQPDSYRPSHGKPTRPSQPRQSSHSSLPTPSTTPQPNPTQPSHGKPAQPVYPTQSTRPEYPTPRTSYEQNPPLARPHEPAQPPYLTLHPQPVAPTTPDPPKSSRVVRFNSAPQVLISTPEHPQEEAQQKRTKFSGLKKAYDATQKNAATRIATRVVAKTAFSAVSNVIGADLGGVIDGAAGLNLGGTGVIDGGSLIGNAVSSAANAAFDETVGKEGHGKPGGHYRQGVGGGWKNLKANPRGRQRVRFGDDAGVGQEHIAQN